jgi:hypothetical protein
MHSNKTRFLNPEGVILQPQQVAANEQSEMIGFRCFSEDARVPEGD